MADVLLAPPAPWRPRAGRWLGIAIFHTAYRGVAIDAHLVPRTGPVVLVANHSGFLDGPLVFSSTPRPVSFLVKQETFHGPLGTLLRGVGQIPVDRGVGDRAALGAASAVLARGGAVGVFPEGTRGRGDVAQVNQGATWLALQSGAAVVPVACLGTRRTGESTESMPRVGTRLVAVFGQPFVIPVEAGVPGRERLRRGSELLRERLSAHVSAAAARMGMPLPEDD